MTYKAMKRKRAGMDADGSVMGWYGFAALSCLIAMILAIVFGDLNYWYNFQPYFDVQNLEYYPNVDPSAMRGAQLMDAGRVEFAQGSRLDLKKSMGFKNLDWYCVVPITKGNMTTKTGLSSYQPIYDFWAVGINCCSGLSSDFQCGEFSSQEA